MSAPEGALSARPLPAWPLLLLAAALAAIQLAAFRWGVILPDTVVQYGQVLSGHYEDWHPPVTAWLWRHIGGARFGSAPLLLADMALYWTGAALLSDHLRRRGHRLFAVAPVLVAALPIPFGAIGAVLKDSLLTASLLAATGLATRRGAGFRVAAAGLTVLAAATRFNGAFAGAPLLLLLPPRAPRSAAGTLLACASGVALLFATSTLINRVALHPVAKGPFIGLVTFDLAGISVESGVNVFPAAERPDGGLLASCYAPAAYNPANRDDCNAIEDDLRDALMAGGRSGVAPWLAAIAAHPLAYAAHRLRHFNANQRWLEAKVPDDAVYLMSADNPYGLAFHPNALTLAIYHGATRLARSPLGRSATWLGVAIALLLFARPLGLSPLARALALSSLLYGAAYLVVSVAPDMRYNVWTMLAALLALVLTLADRPGRRMLAQAAILPAGMILGELAAILMA